MTGLYRFQHTLTMDTNVPGDSITSTTHWRNTSTPTSDFDNVKDIIKDFYTLAASGQAAAVQSYLSADIGPVCYVKAYALADPTPRAPVYEGQFNISASSGTAGLPHEVALCVSFQADREAGQRQNHRRNRFYLGPFTEAANVPGGVPESTMVSDIQKAARTMLAAADNADVWNWVVWSPFRSEYYDLTNGWVDNAWDIQRRRGRAATTRNPFTASSP